MVEFTEEFLKTKKVSQLRDIAKDMHIKGRWDMTKKELISNILVFQENNRELEELQVKKEVASSEVSANEQNAKEKRLNEGVIVAFKKNEKCKSAKVISNNEEVASDIIEVETKMGKKYKINKEDILWVKTGQRWPKGVYHLLVGDGKNARQRNNK